MNDASKPPINTPTPALQETLDETLYWLAEHGQAYDDLCMHFAPRSVKELTLAEVLAWIYDHKQLTEDFLRSGIVQAHNACPHGGDISDDCADCCYAADYCFDKATGQCIERPM